jgi:hypothetical protein
MTAARGLALAAVAMLLPLLGGCSYDYLQHTDRVGASAGNAVAANLEQQTINPMKRSMYARSGLGRNGVVVPEATAGSTAPAPTAGK